MSQTFYFVAEEQVITIRSALDVLDAWLSLTIKAKKHPIANEFRTLPIDAIDAGGLVLGTRTWDGWQNELLRDTYGDNFKDVLEHARDLSR